MPTVEEVIADREFHGLPNMEKQKVLSQIDPDFAALPDMEQRKAVLGLAQKFGGRNAPTLEQPKPEGVTPELQAVIDDMGPLDRVLTGIGRGFVDVGQGAKQIALGAGESVGAVPEGRKDEYTRQIKQEEALYDKPLLDQSPGASAGRFIGNVAATAPIPGGIGRNLVQKVATGALAGGTAAGLMPTDEGESRLANIGIGAATGGAATGLLGAGGMAIKGIRGDRSAATAVDLAAQSRQFNVPLTVGELRQNPSFQRIEQLLERVPLVGTKGFREKQADSLARAAKALSDQYGSGIDDVGDELQGSLARSLKTNKAQASELYDKVGEEAAKRGGTVDLGNVRAAARGLASREKQLPEKFRNQNMLAQVEKWIDATKKPGHHAAKPLLVDAQGKPLSSGADMSKGIDFETARKLRSRLGQEVRKAEKQAISGAVSDEEVAALKMLRRAVEDDIQQFATKDGGELADAFNAANAHYVENVVPFKDRMIRKAGSEDFDTDQIVKTFIKNDRPQLAAKLMGRLDGKGRGAVKFAILKDAFDGAMDGKTPFSPAKFAQRLEKLGKSKNTIFTPDERKHIEGFTRLARAAERAGQYAENPPTGQRVLDAAIGGGVIAGAAFEPSALAFGAGASLTLSKLLTSDLGRKLLTRASGVPPESKLMGRLLMTDLPRALAIGGESANDQK